MKLIVNGEAMEWDGVRTLADAVDRAGAGATRVATVVNDQVVPTDRRAGFALKDGDQIEILNFAGGG